MRMLVLSNSDIQVIKDDHELIELVREYMGYDMSDAIRELIRLSDYNERKLESDLLSYELSLEEYRNGFLDLRDILESLSKVLENKKLNRREITEIVDRMERLISQQI